MYRVLKKWTNQIFGDEEALILLLLIFAVLLLVVTMGNVLAPVIISVILAFMMQGVIAALRNRGLPQWLSMSIAFALFIGGFFALLFILLPIFWQQMTNLINELPRMAQQGQHMLLILPAEYPELISAEQVKSLTGLAANNMAKFGQALLSFSIANIPNLLAVIIYLVLVPILVFFLLKDRELVLHWLASFLPQHRPVLTKVWQEMNQQVANYVRGKAIEIIIVGVVSYAAFEVLGLDYAVLLASLVGLSVVIPYIGAAAVTLPIAMIAWFQWGWGSDFLTVLVVYGIIQALDGNVLVPILFSEAVNLHPLAIILAVLVFGGIWGFWGVFFAIPLATLIKAVINAWPVHIDAADPEL